MPIKFNRESDWGWLAIVFASYPRSGGAGGGTGWLRRTDQRFPCTIAYWVYQTGPKNTGSFHFGWSLSNSTYATNQQAMSGGHHTGTSLAPADDSYAFGVYRNAVGRIQNESANPDVPDSGWSLVHVRFPAGPLGPIAGHSGGNEGAGGGTPANLAGDDCISVGGEYQHNSYPSYPVAWSSMNPMMHFAVWNANLTASELRAMAQNRVSPLLIRPSALRLYYPMFTPGDGGHEYQTGYCLRRTNEITNEPNQPTVLRGFDADTGRATVNYNGTRGKSHHRFLRQPEGFITPFEDPGYHPVLKARGLSQLLNSRSPIGTKIGGLVR